jgi:hypothetical protein
MQVGQKTQKNRMARETINIHANLQSIIQYQVLMISDAMGTTTLMQNLKPWNS